MYKSKPKSPQAQGRSSAIVPPKKFRSKSKESNVSSSGKSSHPRSSHSTSRSRSSRSRSGSSSRSSSWSRIESPVDQRGSPKYSEEESSPVPTAKTSNETEKIPVAETFEEYKKAQKLK